MRRSVLKSKMVMWYSPEARAQLQQKKKTTIFLCMKFFLYLLSSVSRKHSVRITYINKVPQSYHSKLNFILEWITWCENSTWMRLITYFRKSGSGVYLIFAPVTQHRNEKQELERNNTLKAKSIWTSCIDVLYISYFHSLRIYVS